ncbi:ADP-ribosylation factor 1-like [Pelobates fuscus]|uniref:ADP-ribosylation factor 1-like n=1 Tax=Pelobates fuscus TaxID=191477 RepID=UPI002FE45410
MGSMVTRIQGFCGRMDPMKARIVMVGLDGVGKTTILYQMKLNKTMSTIPSIGSRVETLDPISSVSFTLWDVSAGAKGWPLIRHYLPDSHGLVFVVDSTDSERFGEVKENLFWLVFEDTDNLPLIVLVNKQDLEGAHSPADIARYLELEKIKHRRWEICGCCGTDGNGLLEAFEKLSSMVKDWKQV